MNQKNVEALAAAISRSPVFRGFVVNALGLYGEDHPDIREAAEDVAREIIAADGVVVPSALANEEARAVGEASTGVDWETGGVYWRAEPMREALARIAKGER